MCVISGGCKECDGYDECGVYNGCVYVMDVRNKCNVGRTLEEVITDRARGYVCSTLDPVSNHTQYTYK